MTNRTSLLLVFGGVFAAAMFALTWSKTHVELPAYDTTYVSSDDVTYTEDCVYDAGPRTTSSGAHEGAVSNTPILGARLGID